MEEVLAPRRGDVTALPRDDARTILGHLDGMRQLVAAIEPPPDDAAPEAAAPEPADGLAPVAGPAAETVRVDIREMDALLRQVAETSVAFGGIRAQIAALSTLARSGATRGELTALLRTLEAGAERVAVGLEETHERVYAARLVPSSTIFPALERAARDAAEALARAVDFTAIGGDVRLDAHVLSAVGAALAHLVRNAVAHGIEEAPARVAQGKSARGAVRVTVERRGSRVAFACDDDGRGVDLDAVRARAIASGRLPAGASAPSAEELLGLLGEGGLSTSDRVTELAGRGIGVDVARATAERFRGELRVSSEPGRGARFELEVPVSIASISALVVEVEGVAATVPLDAVRRAVRVRPEDIATVDERESISHEGKQIPFLRLERALRIGDAARTRASYAAVVLQAAGATAALGVDRLLGTSSVVMHPVPAYVAADAIIAGAALDAEGNPELVLDARGIVEAAARARGPARVRPRAPLAPILVVDDSLTTRMLEKSILESAGYVVDLATSAEEALAKASERRYAFFVVDVEMPGMDGFGFVAATRADPVLRDIPTVLVTSRGAPEDRARGEAAGAVAYIVKGEFDQGVLLDTLRRWIR